MTDIPLTEAVLMADLAGITPGAITAQMVREGFLDVMHYGAVNLWWYANGATLDDGVTDASAALNAALATGRNVYAPGTTGTYRLLNSINCTTAGQELFGDGNAVSVFTVDSSFANMAASGIFIVSAATPSVMAGCRFRDFGLKFVQPDTSTRASLTTYPDAFYSVSQPKSKWLRMAIWGGTDGINLNGGGSGGSSIEGCNFACFGKNIKVDGSTNDISIQWNLFGPELLTANQQSIYFALNTGAGTVGLACGRADGLHINFNLFIAGLGINFYQGSSGFAFGEMVGNIFDTCNGINCSSNIRITGSSNQFTPSLAAAQSIIMTNGRMELSGSQCYVGAQLTNPQIAISAATGSVTKLILSGGTLSAYIPYDMASISATTTGSGACTLQVSGMNLELAPVAKTLAMIAVNGSAVANISGCSTDPIGGGSGNVVSIANDGRHNITGNTFNGWGLSLPGTHTILVAANNN